MSEKCVIRDAIAVISMNRQYKQINFSIQKNTFPVFQVN